MKIFSVINQKGGVGKTTTAINLASILAALRQRVLLIDLDPQGNATMGVGKSGIHKTSYEVLLEPSSLKEAIKPTFLPCLDILPSNKNLSGAEIELVPLGAREFRLKQALEGLDHPYDFVFIDCPPSLGLLTINALSASTYVLIPVQCEFYALAGLSHLIHTVQLVQRKLNPGLKVWGLVLTMFDGRSSHHKQVFREVSQFLKEKVLLPPIPKNVVVSEAASFGKPVVFYAPRAPASESYLRLSKFFLKEFGSHQGL